MEKEQRNRLQKATQDARKLLEEEFRSQLLQTYDIDVEKVRWAEEPGAHLQAEQRLIRDKLVAWIEHKEAQINDRKEALLLALREMAFTALNRFVALKLMEARELVRPCVSGGLESAGFLEFSAVAQGLLADQESSYRLYLETIFEDVSRELRALFDPRDPASLLWPKRAALLELLDILIRPELAELWIEDETLGWVYQYFNGDAERKKMREESSAPRNSRELAVRNQFFTPRYVVEFLADNTLGRIWYEMRQGNTGLKDRCRYLVRRPNENWLQPGEEPPAQPDTDEALGREELLRQPVHIPHRQLKDPREIRMLDPACGSMHFGLYAFDLYLEIYAEAWEIAQGSGEQFSQYEPFVHFVTYVADFASKVAFLREVPRLILQHNIHGVDIDPRATQIARLTLWLRAQRAWQEQQLEVSGRPPITRSNVVCAEPMPGEKALLREFIDQQFPTEEQKAFRFLLETVFDQMTLAGEAGSLLRIEEEIRSTIAEAKRLWNAGPQYEQSALFAESLPFSKQGTLSLDLSGIADSQFWEQAEHRIYAALQAYAEKAQDGSGFQRRLFVNDTAQGFAFIELFRKRYDVALMNPPFGDASLPSKAYIDERYGDTKGDVYKAFVECFNDRLLPSSHLGIISSRTGFFLGQSEDWRTRVVLGRFRPLVLADLGMGVLDAMVEVAAYVLRSLSTIEARNLTHSIVPVLKKVVRDSQDRFSLSKWQAARGDLKRHQAVAELEDLKARGFIQRSTGDAIRYTPCWQEVNKVSHVNDLAFPPLICIRALVDTDKATALEQSLKSASHQFFVCNPGSFRNVPGTPFAYWATNGILGLFKRLEREQVFITRAGMQTCDDFRFVRLSNEPPPMALAKGEWRTFAKGGAYSPMYADIPLLVMWGARQPELEAFGAIKGNAARSRQSSEHYFRAGLTWPRRTNGLSVRVLPTDCIFADKGPSLFIDGDRHEELMALAALLNSAPYMALVKLQLARVELAQSFEVGLIDATPVPDYGEDFIKRIGKPARKIWEKKYELDSVTPNSHAFIRPALLAVPGSTLSERATEWAACVQENNNFIADCQKEIDRLAFRLYGLEAADCIDAALISTDQELESIEAKGLEEDDSCSADILTLSADLLAYVLGVAYGRWDIRCAMGEQFASESPDPFAPLPICPPGQLQNEHGLPARPEDVPASYPVRIPWDGILVDDPSHPRDMEGYARNVIDIILSNREGVPAAEAIENEICEILSVDSLRDYFHRPAFFFANHLKRYSKSRRQAPIYWQLSAGSGIYALWLYYHRFTKDTLYRVLRDFVEPRIQQAEREQLELESQGALSGDVAMRLHDAQTLLQDLRILKSELDLVAPLWNPNLNDGVIINHAILWRITPYTPWQKKCKECWDKLVKGDYDWAHLAFHLWPERVIPKCTTDRSLAIAHGLEERLWQETNNGNWLPRQLSEADLQALIAEHSNPAVKSALERFLAAPPPVAPTRTRAPRATRSTASGTTRKPRGGTAVVDAEATRQTLLVLSAAPAEGLSRNAIAELLGVEAGSLTAVIKQLKATDQIEQLGAARGARYRLTENGRNAINEMETNG